MTRTRTSSSLLAALTAAALLALAACSSSDSGLSSGGEAAVDARSGVTAQDVAPDAALAEREGGGAAETAGSAGSTDTAGTAGTAGSKARPAPAIQRAVISKGTVELRADDAARARFDVGKVVDRFGGEIAEEDTQTDRKGEVAWSRLVIRVPSESFNDAMDELKTVGRLVNDSRKSTDVTTRVIDTDVRVRAQRRSIQRIQQLLAQARDIGDIVAIESQLSQREAELQSLQQQQAFLADQTALSTITVSIERTPEEREEREDDESGFLAGLDAGWSALAAFAVGLATVAGALLPWLALLVLLGVPALLLLRRLRPRRTAQAG